MMEVFFSDQPVVVRHPSLFLAGPTPRSSDVASWRPQALTILQHIGFAGTVLVPERRDWSVKFNYLDQVEWEYAGLEACSVLAFWVPRDLEKLPGLTTNVEFGRYVASGRVLYGRPQGSPHTGYLDWMYRKLVDREPEITLEGTLRAAVVGAGNTAESKP
jgi:Nucleoside 2-deoxyribosyltransferase like